MSGLESSQNKVIASGSSFYYSFLFLPKLKREAITIFYNFCREVDDIVDEVSDLTVASAKLSWWINEIEQSYNGNPSHPIMIELIKFSQIIKKENLFKIIQGCQMDLTQNRYLDFVDLKKYCHLVAGVVGEVSAEIFGQTQEQTINYAHKLGLAFQLTNIIRDVGEDSLRGRVYLPADELKKFNVKTHEILDRKYSDNFIELMKFQANRAFKIYDEALNLLPKEDFKAQKPGLMMASIYKTLLKEIVESNFQVLNQRIALTPLRKFWLAWKIQALGKF